MTVNEKHQLIYKETANILDELAFIYGIKNIYEPMCSYINISKHTRNMSQICSDIDITKINKLIELKNKSTILIRDEIYSILRKFMTGENYEHIDSGLLELLFNIGYSSDIEVRTLEDVVAYNKEVHLERFDEFSLERFRGITLKNCGYNDLDIKNDSFIILYPPFKTQNILDEKFKYIEMYNWIRNEVNKQTTNNLHIFVLSKDMPDDFVVYTDFSGKIKLNKKDNNNLKLFIHKDSILIEQDNEDLTF